MASLVDSGVVRAYRRLMNVFQGMRGGHRDRMRPMPVDVVEKYHRAIWALDTLGPPAFGDRKNLDNMWVYATHVAENASGPDGGKIAESIIRDLRETCDRILAAVEKDRERAMWEKQRDFLVGSLRRVRRAAMLNDIDHLHYYRKTDAIFSVDLHHPQFQVAYDLWQGLVTELKQAVSRALYSDKPPHMRVEYLLIECRKLIWALEAGDTSRLNHYEKSKLHLSKEEEGRVLWEGIREHAAKVIAQSGAA